ncbi:MAG: lysyl-tRNA synthetase [Candidatus Adlerbacteria bacterium]|nr:lysyl-tRNA synthetase [Candidatus Adlerbacteria bacterium]
MFWADRIAGEIEAKFGKQAEPLLIRDEKTLSGRVHVGSFRGVAIHGVISEALQEQGTPNVFRYEFNDYDPMDGIPSYLPQGEYEQYLGLPLKNIPSPEPGFDNFAEYYGAEFKAVIEGAGFAPEFYRSSELYLSGKMDGVIREALEGAADVRRIYKEVSGGTREDTWLPLSVICPTCGKLSTTRASDFDGETVAVECRDLDWVKGCHFAGRVSPFGGSAKLPWKVEWPAKWKVLGVKVEGAGKDHSTKGGSRDVASHISKEVFKYEPPFDVPYEFFLIGGQKMSSSKGQGSSAKEISDLLPAKLFRLALLSKDISQAFNFDPEGDTIPVLYDLYDKLAEAYKAGVKDDYTRLFLYSHPSTARPNLTVPEFLMRFSQVAFIVQMPHMDLEKEAEIVKGAPLTDADKVELQERAAYAKHWLGAYAPEKFVFKLQESLPEVAQSLPETAKAALKALHDFIAAKDAMPSGEELHAELHKSKEFKAIYLAFLGKESGPKAGWFLSVLDRDFVLKRLASASA